MCAMFLKIKKKQNRMFVTYLFWKKSCIQIQSQFPCVQFVASFWVKPQLCQLKLKTTHGPKQDIKKRVHSSLTSPVQPLVDVYCMLFSVKETDLTTLYNCFVESGCGCFLLGSHGTFWKSCTLNAKAPCWYHVILSPYMLKISAGIGCLGLHGKMFTLLFYW